MFRPFDGASALTILLVSALAGCNAGEARVDTRTDLPTPLPVAVTSPHIADIAAVYAATGTLTAESEAAIVARAGGDIVEIRVEEGDRVSRGQVLARLDGDRARLEMQKARAELDRNTRELARLGNLHERGLVSSASRDALEAEVAATRAAHERATLNYEHTAIRSTIDGVVSRRDVKIGSTLVEGETVFVVTDTNELEAYLDIPQNELQKFSVGHRAALAVDSHPDTTFAAGIERISPTIDPATGTFRATLVVDNADGSLAPGMFGRFTIAWQTYRNALLIPDSATVAEDRDTIVFVVEDGEAVRRSVQTGIRSNGFVQITGGLSLDDDIVLTGQSRLRDGVRVLATAAPAAPRIRG